MNYYFKIKQGHQNYRKIGQLIPPIFIAFIFFFWKGKFSYSKRIYTLLQETYLTGKYKCDK